MDGAGRKDRRRCYRCCDLGDRQAIGEEAEAAVLVAGTALVGLIFSMKVFDAESEEHAARIAKSMIGRALKRVPLRVIEVTEWNG